MQLPVLQLLSLTNGVQLGYRSAPAVPKSDLPTLVLLHPFITDSSFFEPQFTDPQLADQKWNMIAVDIHGHGNTTGRDEFTYWDTATDVGLLLDHFDIPKATFCGTSQGGFIATRLALQRPRLVNRIVYAGSSILVETAESKASITYLTTDFPYIEENLALVNKAGFGVDINSPDATQREIDAGNHWIATWKERYGGSPENEARMVKVTNQLLERDDIVPRVGELDVKIDVMHGELDEIYTVDVHANGTRAVLEANDLLGSFEIVPGGAHYLSWGKWERVNAKLVEIMKLKNKRGEHHHRD
ncbi:Alpha/Beta hydrolase protein [Tricharina praecox]|uniref:Alpha/Beta hydrolase protein n=1 Tax=Tricharina praecox TaxID=43433 RepID=UPI00222089CA|nr:Alpha/Beta hydrolase protein [Tricharina praecox]KAI5855733.1 Alpha/Beta hydrolase protein [Tricharina praecox]